MLFSQVSKLSLDPVTVSLKKHSYDHVELRAGHGSPSVHEKWMGGCPSLIRHVLVLRAEIGHLFESKHLGWTQEVIFTLMYNRSSTGGHFE